jgi:AcrR family transcriptional regulator
MGRRRKGEDDSTVKTRLIERLGEHFFSRGLMDYTMDEVAQTVRVSKKTLYRFFPSRDEMVLQVARVFTGRISAFADKKIRTIEARGPDSYLPQVMELVGRIGSMVLSLPPGFMGDMERRAPHLVTRLEAIRREVIAKQFSRILDLGKRMGYVKQEIDTDIASSVYASMLRQVVSGRGVGPTHAPYDVFITIVRIIFTGILEPAVRLDPAMLRPTSPTGESRWDEFRALAEEPAQGDSG